MVFKRVLKGIGRLMLTTAVMCGVGLFLCSSEVKATINDPSIEIVNTENTGFNDTRFNVTITNKNTEASEKITVKKVELYDDTSCLSLVASFALSTGLEIEGASGNSTFSISNSDFIQKAEYSKLTSGTISIKGVKITYGDSDTSDKTKDYDCSGASPAIVSAPIYKVVVSNDSISGVGFIPSFDNETDGTYVVNGRDMPYGYKGERYSVYPKPNSGYDINNYYNLIRTVSETGDIASNDSRWSPANVIEGEILGTQSDNELKVAYLPKIKTLAIDSVTDAKLSDTKDRIDIITAGTAPVYPVATYKIDGYEEDKETLPIGDALSKYSFVAAVDPSSTTLGILRAEIINPLSDRKCKVTASLMNTNTSGSGSIKISAKLGEKEVCSVPLSVYVGVAPERIIFQNVPISVMVGGGSQVVQVLKGIEPSGANQNFSSYSGEIIETTSGVKLLEQVKYDPATGAVTVQAKSTATPGETAKVKLTLKNGISDDVSGVFDVKIISFDKGKTIDSINKSNKNYITYNKDKGYSLDIKQLIIDNAKDSSGNAITISKDQITVINVGGSSCDGSWKPSEAALNKKVTCKINGVAITESDDLKVSAYPMPTATYSSSNRTLSVKIPTKVATAYSDDNNIRQSKGFKLILEDSSGNTLYEYTDSKYQNVLSSSSESTVTYTVPAADIEGMITSAASNGKFSADTTSVKFKVIPMGYKQSSTSDETIKAKDEIAGKTDAVTVYKVSASGTNFTSSAAYGLDGQTVSITATPNSGYSFKQWSDGNTSNPRQVKVSASGTRAFQAVAGDRVANSTGAGGTDNSELYDDVPKTAESNSAIWLIVFMVFAVMGTTYALYLQLKAANSKHDR